MTEHITEQDALEEFPLAESVTGDDIVDPDEMPNADEFDQELGRRMGENAQRLVNGELSEAEFYEKYHDAVVEEFGEDNRPVAPSESDE
ncbi:MAG: 4Fe-4S ferredoxin N-terminal domain-containing protein [Halobacteriales archaeon]